MPKGYVVFFPTYSDRYGYVSHLLKRAPTAQVAKRAYHYYHQRRRRRRRRRLYRVVYGARHRAG
jgi:hypothetical protein